MAPNTPKTGYEQYRKVQTQTGSRADLVLMLYQGAIRFMNQALAKLDTNDIEGIHNTLVRAQDIILELEMTLDIKAGGTMASRLADLYRYCLSLLVDANMKKVSSPVIEAKQIIQELESAWAEALKQSLSQKKRASTKTEVGILPPVGT